LTTQVNEAKRKSNDVVQECKGVRASLAQVLVEVAKFKVNDSPASDQSTTQEGSAPLGERMSKMEGVVGELTEQARLMPAGDVLHDLNIIWKFLKGLLIKDNPNWEREQQ